METLIKAYEFDDKNTITILRFLMQFRQAWGSSRVFEGMALKTMPSFMKKRPAASLEVWLLPSQEQWNHQLTAKDVQRAGPNVCGICWFLVEITCHGFEHCKGNIRYSLLKRSFKKKFRADCLYSSMKSRTLWKRLFRRAFERNATQQPASQYSEREKNVLVSLAKRASVGECPVRRYATTTNRTSAEPNDSSCLEELFLEKSSKNTHCGSRSQTKIQVFKKFLPFCADIKEKVSS